MKCEKIPAAVILLVGGLTLTACAESDATPSAEEGAAIVQPLSGTSELSKVTLVGQAAERLGIETERVRHSGAAAGKTVIPYAAVIYDPAGGTWTYTQVKPMTFIRDAIVVDRIVGSRAILAKGPAVGTSVVTVGAAELYGAEVGVDH